MKVDGPHHVTAITADIEANLRFYGRLAGLRPVWQGVNADDPEMRHVTYGDERGSPGSIVTFFDMPGIVTERPGSGSAGIAACAITLVGRTARAGRPAAAGRGADSPDGKPGDQPVAEPNERRAP